MATAQEEEEARRRRAIIDVDAPVRPQPQAQRLRPPDPALDEEVRAGMHPLMTPFIKTSDDSIPTAPNRAIVEAEHAPDAPTGERRFADVGSLDNPDLFTGDDTGLTPAQAKTHFGRNRHKDATFTGNTDLGRWNIGMPTDPMNRSYMTRPDGLRGNPEDWGVRGNGPQVNSPRTNSPSASPTNPTSQVNVSNPAGVPPYVSQPVDVSPQAIALNDAKTGAPSQGENRINEDMVDPLTIGTGVVSHKLSKDTPRTPITDRDGQPAKRRPLGGGKGNVIRTQDNVTPLADAGENAVKKAKALATSGRNTIISAMPDNPNKLGEMVSKADKSIAALSGTVSNNKYVKKFMRHGGKALRGLEKASKNPYGQIAFASLYGLEEVIDYAHDGSAKVDVFGIDFDKGKQVAKSVDVNVDTMQEYSTLLKSFNMMDQTELVKRFGKGSTVDLPKQGDDVFISGRSRPQGAKAIEKFFSYASQLNADGDNDAQMAYFIGQALTMMRDANEAKNRATPENAKKYKEQAREQIYKMADTFVKQRFAAKDREYAAMAKGKDENQGFWGDVGTQVGWWDVDWTDPVTGEAREGKVPLDPVLEWSNYSPTDDLDFRNQRGNDGFGDSVMDRYKNAAASGNFTGD